MKLKMKRDYKPNYKFGWMKKDNTYDTSKIDVLSEKQAQSLVDSGYAVKVTVFAKAKDIKESKRVVRLESLKGIDDTEKDEAKKREEARKVNKLTRGDASKRLAAKKKAIELSKATDVKPTLEELVANNIKKDLIAMVTKEQQELAKVDDLETLNKTQIAKIILGA